MPFNEEEKNMKPEDIDNLFKERLGNSAPTPPADMWARLQGRMQSEAAAEETPVALPQEAEQKTGKQRYMWMYSSVAATLSLLLTVGVVFYNINTGTPEISETLTKHDVRQPQELPVARPEVAPAPEAVEPAGAMALQETAAAQESEKNVPAQATATQPTASNTTKAPEQRKAIAQATTTPKAVQQQSLVEPTVEKVTEADAQPAIAANTQPARTASTVPATATDAAAPSALATAKADANMNAEPVEIIIKRSFASPAAAAESNPQEDVRKKGALAKNIFKQVRNLAAGEGVELSELGIRADRVALETRIGKQKISKVINL
ncbi:hypothetical protein CA264_05690 [Pontibacter actiniarum]|uniref:Uncharacterized protein n=2 Tax=Pontibacter actiniarum TaxID=323450 RepID=A0A1X9YQ57_9BACT|nr:hypothetical protein CA264_05690 [Pontibacter actiniarum]